MAQYQWTASSETTGNAPALLENLLTGSGQSLSEWQIVANASASGGKTLKLLSSTTMRRRLVLPGVTATGRIDIRGRVYIPPGTTTFPHFGVARATGTTQSNNTDFFVSTSSGGALTLYAYDPAQDALATGNNRTWSGWCRFRYTAANTASPVHRFAMWQESGSGSDISPDQVLTTSATDPAVTGNRMGLGSNLPTAVEWDWVTFGTAGDNALADPATTGIKGVRITLYDGATAKTNQSNLRAVWWDTGYPSAFGGIQTSGQTTSSTGVFEWNIHSVTTLGMGASGFLVIHQLNASDALDLVFAGRVPLTDIS